MPKSFIPLSGRKPTPTVQRSVEVSIADFTDEQVQQEALQRGIIPSGLQKQETEKATAVKERLARFDFIEKVLDEIKRGYVGEAVFLLERERDKIRPPEARYET